MRILKKNLNIESAQIFNTYIIECNIVLSRSNLHIELAIDPKDSAKIIFI